MASQNHKNDFDKIYNLKMTWIDFNTSGNKQQGYLTVNFRHEHRITNFFKDFQVLGFLEFQKID